MGLQGELITFPGSPFRVDWVLFSCTADPPRKGIGTRLISEFVKTVRRGSAILATVSHLPTQEHLENEGILQQALQDGMFTTYDHELITRLPVVPMLEKGGISIVGLTIYMDHEFQADSPYVIKLLGRT